MSVSAEGIAAYNLRLAVVKELTDRKSELLDFLPGIADDWDGYLANMSDPSAWGAQLSSAQLSLAAAAAAAAAADLALTLMLRSFACPLRPTMKPNLNPKQVGLTASRPARAPLPVSSVLTPGEFLVVFSLHTGEPEMVMASNILKRPISVYRVVARRAELVVTYGEGLPVKGISLLWQGAHYDLLVDENDTT
ncbi:MAG: hypothetical protein WDW38_003943 [Sanguina aurantia]